MKPVTFAVAGMGWAGRVNAAGIEASPLTELLAVVDPVAPADGKNVAWYSTMAELLENDLGVEAVAVSVPHHLLAPIGREAATLGGCHLFLEKPGALRVEDLDEMAATGREITANYWHRQRPAAKLARQLIQEGALGEVAGVECRMLTHRSASYWAEAPWRGQVAEAGGGVLMSQAIHYVDLIRFLTGQEFARVSAECDISPPDGIERRATLSFRLAGGAVGSLLASTTIRQLDIEEVLIWGEYGRVAVKPSGVKVYSTRPSVLGRPGREHRKRTRPMRHPQGARQAIHEFARRIRTQDGLSPTISDLKANLRVVLAAYQAAALGKSVAT